MAEPVVGGTGLATATPKPAGAVVPNAPVWSSSDVTIATIDAAGTKQADGTYTSPIAYLAPGTVTFSIVETLPDGTVISKGATVTVPVPAPPQVTDFDVTIS